MYIPVNFLLLYPNYHPTKLLPQRDHSQMFTNVRHVATRRRAAQVGLLLMVRIVDFYRKRMQQRKAGELWGYDGLWGWWDMMGTEFPQRWGFDH